MCHFVLLNVPFYWLPRWINSIYILRILFNFSPTQIPNQMFIKLLFYHSISHTYYFLLSIPIDLHYNSIISLLDQSNGPIHFLNQSSASQSIYLLYNLPSKLPTGQYGSQYHSIKTQFHPHHLEKSRLTGWQQRFPPFRLSFFKPVSKQPHTLRTPGYSHTSHYTFSIPTLQRLPPSSNRCLQGAISIRQNFYTTLKTLSKCHFLQYNWRCSGREVEGESYIN